MYKDCMITVICNLGFYGEVLVKYIEKNNEEVSLKFILNKNKSVIGNIMTSNGNIIEELNFNTVKDVMEYLEKIVDKIYLIEVA